MHGLTIKKMEAECSSKRWNQHNTLHSVVIQKITMLIFTVSKTSGMSVTYCCIPFLSGFPQLKSSFSSGGSCMTGKQSTRSVSTACECNIMRRNFVVSSDSHTWMEKINWYMLIIKPTTCTNFSNLFWNEILHVSDSSSVHRQEFFTVHTAMVYVIQVCRQLVSRIRMLHPDPAHKLSTNLYDIYHCCVYSEKLLTMDRGTVRNM
jgi:hypothetical protein